MDHVLTSRPSPPGRKKRTSPKTASSSPDTIEIESSQQEHPNTSLDSINHNRRTSLFLKNPPGKAPPDPQVVPHIKPTDEFIKFASQEKEKHAILIQKFWKRKLESDMIRTNLLFKAWEQLDEKEDAEHAAAYKSPLTKNLLSKVVPSSNRHGRGVSTVVATQRLKQDTKYNAKKEMQDNSDCPVLPPEINREYVITVINRFRNHKSIPSVDVMRILMRIAPLLQALPNVVTVPIKHKITVVGDLHGQLDDLFTIFKMNGLPSEENCYVFNGDFVDRGCNGFECAMTIFLFKLLYPESVHLNRGNHEARDLNEWGGFETECVEKYNLAVYDMMQEVFASLPLATIIQDSIFVVHAGLFAKENVTLEHVQSLDRFHEVLPSNMELEDMLWSDPGEMNGRIPNDRGAGVLFGPDVTRDFLERWGLDLIVRSHEVKDFGFEAHHDDMLVTCFSASNYCGVCDNQGAVIVFRDDADPECVQYVATPIVNSKPFMAHRRNRRNRGANTTSTSGPVNKKEKRLQNVHEDIIRKLSPMIATSRTELSTYWANFDPFLVGRITSMQFHAGLYHILNLDLPFMFLFEKYGLEMDEDEYGQSVVNYFAFLDHFKAKISSDGTSSPQTQKPTDLAWEVDDSLVDIPTRQATASVAHTIDILTDFVFQYRYSLKYLFKYLDSDGTGKVSTEQFKEGVTALNSSLKEQLSPYQIGRVLEYVDQDEDGFVSYEEFFRCFYINAPHQQAPVIKKWTKPEPSTVIDPNESDDEEYITLQQAFDQDFVYALWKICGVFIDEFHQIGDFGRGYRIELLISKLKYFISFSGIKIQIVGFSATVERESLERLCTWIPAKKFIVSDEERPIKLNECFIEMERSFAFGAFIKRFVDDDKSVIVFCPTKKHCKTYANLIAKEFETVDIDMPEENYDIYQDCFHKRVAYHNSAVSKECRSFIEKNFRNRILRVISSTSTLAAGVNLPADVVVIIGCKKANSYYTKAEYRQMVGRAGRIGHSDSGESFILYEKADDKMRQFLMDKGSLPPLHSCLKNISLFQELCINALFLVRIDCARDYLNQSWFSNEDNSNAMEEMFQEILYSLRKDGFLSDKNNATLLLKASFISSMTLNQAKNATLDISELLIEKKPFLIRDDFDLHILYFMVPIDLCNKVFGWEVIGNQFKALRNSNRYRRTFNLILDFFGLDLDQIHLFKSGRLKDKAVSFKRLWIAYLMWCIISGVPLDIIGKRCGFGEDLGILEYLLNSVQRYGKMLVKFLREMEKHDLFIIFDHCAEKICLELPSKLRSLRKYLSPVIAKKLADNKIRTLDDIINTQKSELIKLLDSFDVFTTYVDTNRRNELEDSVDSLQNAAREESLQ